MENAKVRNATMILCSKNSSLVPELHVESFSYTLLKSWYRIVSFLCSHLSFQDTGCGWLVFRALHLIGMETGKSKTKYRSSGREGGAGESTVRDGFGNMSNRLQPAAE